MKGLKFDHLRDAGWQRFLSSFATRPHCLQIYLGSLTRGLSLSTSMLHGQQVRAHSLSSPQHFELVSPHIFKLPVFKLFKNDIQVIRTLYYPGHENI